uniref:Uncharacterized protein n=1 Tax=Branchiostoma floridae TaxID=7739 RepID=C3ZA87_BRAFL|eukprot:XP_002594469.1 hypothetical protein BRAFLDRAFT_87658 [Branchiostoma floridae]
MGKEGSPQRGLMTQGSESRKEAAGPTPLPTPKTTIKIGTSYMELKPELLINAYFRLSENQDMYWCNRKKHWRVELSVVLLLQDDTGFASSEIKLEEKQDDPVMWAQFYNIQDTSQSPPGAGKYSQHQGQGNTVSTRDRETQSGTWNRVSTTDRRNTVSTRDRETQSAPGTGEHRQHQLNWT